MAIQEREEPLRENLDYCIKESEHVFESWSYPHPQYYGASYSLT